MRRRLLLPALPALLGPLLLAGPARASEGQWHLGAGFGNAGFTASGQNLAPAFGAHGAYELSDLFDLRAELLLALPSESGATAQWDGSAGLTYKLDVIQIVPYVGVLLGYYDHGNLRPVDEAQRELGFSVPAGVDWALSRSFALGLELRYHGFFSNPPTSLGEAAYFSELLRAEYRFGW